MTPSEPVRKRLSPDEVDALDRLRAALAAMEDDRVGGEDPPRDDDTGDR